MSGQALSDLKVLEYGEFISAPYAGKLLADLGAEVIKVEPIRSGDVARSYGPFPSDTPHRERSGLFLYLNTNKFGVTLDTKTPTGQAIFTQLVKTADVLLTNYSPDRMSELGLSYDDLRQVNPGLILTSITPYGLTGPWSNYKGYHLNACAFGGACLVGSPDREPLAYPLLQGHIQGGAHATAATLVALFARDLTGLGQEVDISEAGIWASFFGGAGPHGFIFSNRMKRRSGFRNVGFFYPNTILPCKDGYICEIAVRGSEWKKFLEIIGNGQIPDWYANEPRFKDRVESSVKYADELDSLQEPWLMAHTKEEIFALCREKGIPFAPVYDVDEIVNHPHLKERAYFVQIERPEVGALTYPGAPYKLSEGGWQINRPAPLLGEHNEEIYCDHLSYSKEDLVLLTQAGVI